jgi:hypothetical protein
MRTARLILLIFSFAMATERLYSQNGQDTTASVSGHVYDDQGVAVADAVVVTFPLESAVSGLVPHATTDEHGSYRLSSPAYGKTRICASKPGFGYPYTVAAVFVSGEEKEPEVNLSPGSDYRDVDIHLPLPDGSIEGILQDDVTGRPIEHARITLRRADDLSIRYSTDVPKAGVFRYDLPNRAIKIFITAAGYQPWEFTDTVTGNSFVKIQPHEHKTITIKLKPST